jgi:O-acetylserine/cysteine efflux transporter
MRKGDVAAALLIVVVWGVNFVAIDLGLTRLPPLLFVAVRFLLVAFPAVLLVPRPQVGWRTVVALGMLMCVGQFGFLFVGMSEGMNAGLSSVIMQTQALFTVVFAAFFLRERPRGGQLLGLGVAAAGLGLISADREGAPLHALLFLVAGSACWGAANVVTRAARPTRPFSLLVYSAMVAPLPLLALSLAFEGAGRDLRALRSIDVTVVWSMGYVVVLATFGGFGGWYALLRRYESTVVAPFAVLVPVSGLTAAWIILGERPSPMQAAGSVIAMLGVALVVRATSRAVPPGVPLDGQRRTWSTIDVCRRGNAAIPVAPTSPAVAVAAAMCTATPTVTPGWGRPGPSPSRRRSLRLPGPRQVTPGEGAALAQPALEQPQ